LKEYTPFAQYPENLVSWRHQFKEPNSNLSAIPDCN
jgi:hypothetical protein